MKLLRFTTGGASRLDVMADEAIVPLDALASDYPTMQSIIEGGDIALAKIKAATETPVATIPHAEATLLAPIERPGKYRGARVRRWREIPLRPGGNSVAVG